MIKQSNIKLSKVEVQAELQKLRQDYDSQLTTLQEERQRILDAYDRALKNFYNTSINE